MALHIAAFGLSVLICKRDSPILVKTTDADANTSKAPTWCPQPARVPQCGSEHVIVWLYNYVQGNCFILEDKPDTRKQLYEPFLNTDGGRGEIINN